MKGNLSILWRAAEPSPHLGSAERDGYCALTLGRVADGVFVEVLLCVSL